MQSNGGGIWQLCSCILGSLSIMVVWCTVWSCLEVPSGCLNLAPSKGQHIPSLSPCLSLLLSPPFLPPSLSPSLSQADNVLKSILDHLCPQWVVNYHEHDSLLEHVFSEELSEEDRKVAWDEYRAQMTRESTNYYNYHSLQNQLATAQGSLQAASLAPTLGNELSNVKPEAGRDSKPSHQATELLTVLSNTNKNVENLIGLLDSKVTLRSMVSDFQRRLMPAPPNLMGKIMESGRLITEHYALVEEGVKRVNATLQKCHTGQIHLEPGANQLANDMRSRLIKNLDTLRSGSKQPVMNATSVAGPSSHAGGVSQQHAAYIQRLIQARAQQRAILQQPQKQQQQRQAELK